MPDDVNPWAHLSDAELVRRASQGPLDAGQYSIEMTRRLKDTLERQMSAANELSWKIHLLSRALLYYTVALAFLAAFQFGAWLRDLMH
jgi:hypothetical protein